MDKQLKGKRLFDSMKRLEGARQWDTAVGMIQKWFYGSYIKAAWCATCVCYAANYAGVPFPKAENVYTLMCKCKGFANEGRGQFFKYDGTQPLKQGDVLFWLWRGKMSVSASKHVGVCAADTPAKTLTVPCIGGNQSNAVCTRDYEARCLYAVYRPL